MSSESKEIGKISGERAKALLKAVVDAVFNGPRMNFSDASDEEIINYLIALGFDEEELMVEFGVSEGLIDAANAALG